MATRWRRSPGWVWRIVPNRVALVAGREHRTLEGIATAVWIVLDEPGTSEDVFRRIVELGPDQLAPALVEEAIGMMRSAGVIEEAPAESVGVDDGIANADELRNGPGSLAARRTPPPSEWTVDAMLRTIAVQHLIEVPESLRTAALPGGPVDARQLISLAEAQRLLGSLLDLVLTGALELDDADHEHLVERQAAVMAWCLMVEARLGEVRRWFDEAGGVDHLVIKGSAIAHLDETDPTLRSFADLDLLVRAEHIDRAVAVLSGHGATRPRPERRPGFDRRFAKSVTMTCPDGVEIDLHRTLCDGVHAERIPLDELFGAATTLRLGGAQVGVLSRPHRFLHAAYHAVLGSPVPKRSNLRDLAGYASSADLSPSVVAPIAARWRGTAVLATAVRAAFDEFDLRVPAWDDWLERIVIEPRELRIIERQRVGGSSFRRNSLDRLREMKGLRRRCAYAAAVLAPSPEHRRALRV